MQKANLRNKTLNSKQAKKCVYLLHNIICIMFKYACFVEDLYFGFLYPFAAELDGERFLAGNDSRRIS